VIPGLGPGSGTPCWASWWIAWTVWASGSPRSPQCS